MARTSTSRSSAKSNAKRIALAAAAAAALGVTTLALRKAIQAAKRAGVQTEGELGMSASVSKPGPGARAKGRTTRKARASMPRRRK